MTDSVIDFVEKRNEAIEQRRREFERVMFKNFLGIYVMIEDHMKASPVEIMDISDKGCLFQVPNHPDHKKRYKKDMEVHLRIYFSAHSFLPVSLNVRYHTEYVDSENNHFLRYGCEFDKTSHSFEAMESFIEFIYKFAEHSCSDRHDSRQGTSTP